MYSQIDMKFSDESFQRLYGAFYRGVSRLSEEKAVHLGKELMMFLPLDRVWDFTAVDERLRTNLGRCELPNPIILAPCYCAPGMFERAMKFGFGGISTKATLEPRRGNPEPTIVRRGDGFVNCVGYRNPGMEETQRMLAGMERGVPLFVSITGDEIEDYCALVEGLDPHVDGFYLNLSCPNTESGLRFSRLPGALELFRETRGLTKKNLAAKLSPNREFEESNRMYVVPAAIEYGIDVINFGNTETVDEPRLSMGKGGLSGPELFPKVLETVKAIYEEFGEHIDIEATGGIDSRERARAVMGAGAKAVSYVTGFVRQGPMLAKRINNYLLSETEERGLDSVGGLVGIDI